MKFYPHITDQIAHALVPLAILALAWIGTAWAFALAGLAMGLIRELSEAGGSRITWPEVKAHFAKGFDPWIDLTFWALGGAVAGVLL
jgi:hypothetical protein